MKEVVELLRTLPLFSTIGDDALLNLARLATVKALARGEILCSKGEPAHSMYVLQGGQLRIYELSSDGREAGLRLLHAPEIFGEMGVIDDQPRSAHIIATTSAKVISIPKRAVMEIMTATPAAALSMFRHLTGMIRKLSNQQRMLAMPSVKQRLCALLIDLCTRDASGTEMIAKLPPQRELAIMVNSSRETVSRLLQRMMEDGWLQKDRHRLLLLNSEMIHDTANGG